MGFLHDFYRQDLIQLAEKIIEAKSTVDDKKAFEDMYVLCKILNGEEIGIVEPIKVDMRLRQEYPSIEEIEHLASQFPRINNVSGKCFDELTIRLHGDLRGICADVLMKHGEITELKEIIAAEN